jgi:hypothetical protein
VITNLVVDEAHFGKEMFTAGRVCNESRNADSELNQLVAAFSLSCVKGVVRIPATPYLVPLFTLIYLILFTLLLPSIWMYLAI